MLCQRATVTRFFVLAIVNPKSAPGFGYVILSAATSATVNVPLNEGSGG